VKVFTLLPSHLRLGVILSGIVLLGACSYTHESIPEPTCPSVPKLVSYQDDVLPILKDDCYRCHSAANYNNPYDPSNPNGSNGALNMESFAALKTWTQTAGGAESYIVGSIKHLPGYNKMPYDGTPGPEPCEIAIIKAWVDAGAPNN
jgi:hypothetical protein